MIDVDVVAVERACSGERLPLRAAETAAAVGWLLRHGLSQSEAAARLGVARQTLQKWVERGRYMPIHQDEEQVA